MTENSRYNTLIREATSPAEAAFYELAAMVGPLDAYKYVAGLLPIFEQPRQFISDSYTTAALEGACDEIRNAVEGDGNNAVNRACLAIGTLVASAWNDLTLELAEAAVNEALDSWTSINQGIFNTVRHALQDGMRQPRPEPVQGALPASRDPLKRDPLKSDPLKRRARR